jgi:serine/threonine protein kinase/tetratricopeptide (TPR) repeat protein
MDDLTGQVYGNYRLIRLIGSGGFASVYEGEHNLLNTKVAVKILGRLESYETERFLQEAKIIADLRHPNIIRLLDFAIQDGRPFLVMEYAASGTLADRHPKGAILTLHQVVSYVKQVATALQYAHDRSLIHRDVKPNNMLVQENDEIVLSDFGIARISSDSNTTATGVIVGTPIFMAPEQALGRARPASDQYSLAICVYLWLCGTYPFQGSNPVEIIHQHLEVQPRPPRELNPAIPPQVEQVLLMALAKRPEDRFSTVEEFARYLEDASLGREVVIPSPAQKLSHVRSSSLIPPPPSVPPMISSERLSHVGHAAADWRGEQTAYFAPPPPPYSVPPLKRGLSSTVLLPRLLTYLLVMPLLILLTPLLLLYYYCTRALRKARGPALEARRRPSSIAIVLLRLPLPEGFWPARLLIGEWATPSLQTPWNHDPYGSPAVDLTLLPPTLAPTQGEQRNEPSVVHQSKAWWRRVAYALVKGPLSLRPHVQSAPPLYQYQPPYQYDPYRPKHASAQTAPYPPTLSSASWGNPPAGPIDSGAIGEPTTGERKNFCVVYHDNDRNWAEWIAWLLEEDGLSTIVPDWDFRAGYNVVRETRKAINEAQRVIVIISPDYLDTHNAQWGIVFSREMMSQEGMILPVVVKECAALRKPLDTLVPINLVGRDVFHTSHKLRKAVRLVRSKPTNPPAFPPTAQEAAVSAMFGQQSTSRLDLDRDQQQDVTTGESTGTRTTDPVMAPTTPFSLTRDVTISFSHLAEQIESAFDQKDWPDVIRKSKLLIEHSLPTSIPWKIYRMQALAYHSKGQMAEGRAALETALALVSDKRERLALLDEYTNALASLKRWQEMLIYTEEALTLAPQDIRWQALREQITQRIDLERPGKEDEQSSDRTILYRTTQDSVVQDHIVQDHIIEKQTIRQHIDQGVQKETDGRADIPKELPIDQTVRQMETIAASANPITIFIAYAPNDAELCANLKNQLTTLIYQHQLRIWYDHDISPGKERMKIMEERLNGSLMIILLVSAYFLGSEYHYRQMQLALEMHRAGTKRIIPILLRPSDWEKTPLGELQALPKGNRPVTTWRNMDEAFVDIVKGIRLAVEELQMMLQ